MPKKSLPTPRLGYHSFRLDAVLAVLVVFACYVAVNILTRCIGLKSDQARRVEGTCYDRNEPATFVRLSETSVDAALK